MLSDLMTELVSTLQSFGTVFRTNVETKRDPEPALRLQVPHAVPRREAGVRRGRHGAAGAPSGAPVRLPDDSSFERIGRSYSILSALAHRVTTSDLQKRGNRLSRRGDDGQHGAHAGGKRHNPKRQPVKIGVEELSDAFSEIFNVEIDDRGN